MGPLGRGGASFGVRNFANAGAVWIHDVDLVIAFAIGGERDLSAFRGPRRPAIERGVLVMFTSPEPSLLATKISEFVVSTMRRNAIFFPSGDRAG